MREGIDAGGNYLQANLKRIEDSNGPPHSKVLHIFDRQPDSNRGGSERSVQDKYRVLFFFFFERGGSDERFRLQDCPVTYISTA